MFGGAPHVRVGPDVLFVVFCLGFVSGAASQAGSRVRSIQTLDDFTITIPRVDPSCRLARSSRSLPPARAFWAIGLTSHLEPRSLRQLAIRPEVQQVNVGTSGGMFLGQVRKLMNRIESS